MANVTKINYSDFELQDYNTKDENLIIDKSFTAKDIDGWDSLTHIMLIFEIEKNFEIKFLSSEMTSWSNIGEIVMSIKSKL